MNQTEAHAGTLFNEREVDNHGEAQHKEACGQYYRLGLRMVDELHRMTHAIAWNADMGTLARRMGGPLDRTNRIERA